MPSSTAKSQVRFYLRNRWQDMTVDVKHVSHTNYTYKLVNTHRSELSLSHTHVVINIVQLEVRLPYMFRGMR